MIEFEKITTEEQIKTFAKTADEIWHEYFGFIITEEQINYMLDKFQSFDAVKKQIEDGYEYYFLRTLSDGKIAGYTGICVNDEELFLSKLYIKKEYRNSGLGRKTFEFLKTFKAPKIRLTVNKYNDSTIAAYQKWGFSTVDSVVTDIGRGYVMDDYILEYSPLSKG